MITITRDEFTGTLDVARDGRWLGWITFDPRRPSDAKWWASAPASWHRDRAGALEALLAT